MAEFYICTHCAESSAAAIMPCAILSRPAFIRATLSLSLPLFWGSVYLVIVA